MSSVSAVSGVASPQALPTERIHTAQHGDNLTSIGQQYGVAPDAIAKANPQIINPNCICPGDQLVIPDSANPNVAAEMHSNAGNAGPFPGFQGRTVPLISDVINQVAQVAAESPLPPQTEPTAPPAVEPPAPPTAVPSVPRQVDLSVLTYDFRQHPKFDAINRVYSKVGPGGVAALNAGGDGFNKWFPEFQGHAVEVINAYFGGFMNELDLNRIADPTGFLKNNPQLIALAQLPPAQIADILGGSQPFTEVPGRGGDVYRIIDSVPALTHSGPASFTPEQIAFLQQGLEALIAIDPVGTAIIQNAVATQGTRVNVIPSTTGSYAGNDPQLGLVIGIDFGELNALRFVERGTGNQNWFTIDPQSALVHESIHLTEVLENRPIIEQDTVDRTNALYRAPNGLTLRGPYALAFDTRLAPIQNALLSTQASQTNVNQGPVQIVTFALPPTLTFDLGSASTLTVATDFGFGPILPIL